VESATFAKEKGISQGSASTTQSQKTTSQVSTLAVKFRKVLSDGYRGMKRMLRAADGPVLLSWRPVVVCGISSFWTAVLLSTSSVFPEVNAGIHFC